MKKVNDRPENYKKYFDYYEEEVGDVVLYDRIVKEEYKHIDIKELERLSSLPCMNHKFKNGNCIKCGAIEKVFQYWKQKDKYYAGNGNII